MSIDAPIMNRVFFSLLFVAFVVGGLLVFQASRVGTSDVLLPSALAAEPEGSVVSRIRVAGRVSSDPIDYAVQPAFELKFTVLDPGTKELGVGGLPVVYRGVKPDMFAPGRDVIMDGNFSGGVLEATKLLTQCPSKYEAPKPTDKYSGAMPTPDQAPRAGL
jgi:cytochrome c-type biogenesis protein CcmE